MQRALSPPEVIMLATADIQDYAQYSRIGWETYCAAHGYHFFHYPHKLLHDMHVNWSKIEMVRQHLKQTKSDVVALVDADTYVCDPELDLDEIAITYPEKELLFSRDCRNIGPFVLPLNYEAAFKYKTRILPNAGFVIIRNNEFARNFFDTWLHLARHDLKSLANTHPRNQLVLWEGLYFQNKDRIGLLNRLVERVRDVAHIGRAISHGAKVVHVKDGLNQEQFKALQAIVLAANKHT